MATKSTRAPARRKSVSTPQATLLTPAMIEAHARKQALQEIFDFMDNWTEAEREITRHLRPFGDPVKGIKEIRRLRGVSIAKCKVIPFPIRNSQSKSVMES
ncbi:hypothetical protein [Nitrosomonas oligotropha]|uniref:hypothetical protein n=1 Tax=Nitrosomonas oligotropha TaxID=42354 RepID=UPI001368FC1A|nr:hypothetical protein [Nitrosomonas oligotropha]